MATATEMSTRVNLRRARAISVVHAVLQAVRPFLDREDCDAERSAHNALMELIEGEGWEVLTDLDRPKFGLPSRGPDGWTAEEIVALERARIEAILKPFGLVEAHDAAMRDSVFHGTGVVLQTSSGPQAIDPKAFYKAPSK